MKKYRYAIFTFYSLLSLLLMFSAGKYIENDLSYGISLIILAIAMQLRVYYFLYKNFKKEYHKN